MHEYPITLHIIEMAAKYAKQACAQKVKRISLVIGDDAGYVGDSIHLYFDALAEKTPCEGAELFITRVRPQLQCTKCEMLFYRKPFSFDCPECGSEGHPTTIGKEFYIDSIEVEPSEEPCPTP